MRATLLLPILLLLMITVELKAQTRIERQRRERGYIDTTEIVSIVKTTPFDQAIKILSDLSKKFRNKIIIDPENRKTPINVDIDKMYWRDAFDHILKSNNLNFQESDEFIKITPGEKVAEKEGAKARPTLFTREVQISAVFFEIDASRVRESGIDWKLTRGNNVNLTIQENAAKRVSSNIFSITGTPRTKYDIDIETLIKLFESNSLGEVISRPQITVRSGKPGNIQVGVDFPVNTRDALGNISTVFQHAGTIITVTPEVYSEKGTDFIHLKIATERSFTTPTAAGIQVDKTSASTDALLIDGEETVIAGLYSNEEKEIREGIPILKDLPWWVFGLRYLFGFNHTELIRKDLIILIKANLIPGLKDRVVTRENLIEKKMKEFEEDTKFRQGERQPYKK